MQSELAQGKAEIQLLLLLLLLLKCEIPQFIKLTQLSPRYHADPSRTYMNWTFVMTLIFLTLRNTAFLSSFSLKACGSYSQKIKSTTLQAPYRILHFSDISIQFLNTRNPVLCVGRHLGPAAELWSICSDSAPLSRAVAALLGVLSSSCVASVL